MKANLQDEKVKIATLESKSMMAWTKSCLKRLRLPYENTKKGESGTRRERLRS